MTDAHEPRPDGENVDYDAPDGEVALNLRLEQETVWLTREQMAAVSASTTENIRQQLRNLFVDGEVGGIGNYQGSLRSSIRGALVGPSPSWKRGDKPDPRGNYRRNLGGSGSLCRFCAGSERRPVPRGTERATMTEERVGDVSPGGEVVVYEAPDGEVHLSVRLKEETVWLTLRQMAALFERDLSVVSRHIRNAYREGELEREATFAKFATVRREGGRSVQRQIEHFDLDVIITVGYRVKSLRGTQFRQWATRTLREHLVRGYTLNERRLAERGLREARGTLDPLARTLRSQSLVSCAGEAVLELVTSYADTWRRLLEYDEDRLKAPAVNLLAEPLG